MDEREPIHPGLSLRRASLSDADGVRELVRAAYSRWIPTLGREPLPMLADYVRAISEHRLDLLEDGSELVGVIETMTRSDHLWIENVAVRPHRQGHGLGRRLLAHAEALAAAEGRSEVRLLTNSAFESNVDLYRRFGYEIALEEPFMGGATVYMAKRLS